MPQSQQQDSRRDFFKTAVGVTGAVAFARRAMAQETLPGGLPTRRLGRTGEQVSILCLGGAHIGRTAKSEAGDGRHEHFKSTRRFHGPIYRRMHGLPVEGDFL